MLENTKPKLRIELTSLDIILEIVGWVTLALNWCLTIIGFVNLSDIIPTHYNFSGEIDSYGSKNTIFFLPAITTVMFLGMTLLNRYPHIFNYPVEITETNAYHQYSNATRLIRLLKLIITFIFTCLVLFIYLSASGVTGGLTIWFLPVIILLIFIPVIIYIIKSFKTNN